MSALEIWKEKLDFLQAELPLASGDAKFSILKGIEEAKEMIKELEGNGAPVVSKPVIVSIDTKGEWNWDDLNGQQLQQLQEAILKAFNRQELAQLIAFELDEQLNNLVSANSNFSVTVFKVLEWAERNGRLKELFDAVVQARPNNGLLKQIQVGSQANP